MPLAAEPLARKRYRLGPCRDFRYRIDRSNSYRGHVLRSGSPPIGELPQSAAPARRQM